MCRGRSGTALIAILETSSTGFLLQEPQTPQLEQPPRTVVLWKTSALSSNDATQSDVNFIYIIVDRN